MQQGTAVTSTSAAPTPPPRPPPSPNATAAVVSTTRRHRCHPPSPAPPPTARHRRTAHRPRATASRPHPPPARRPANRPCRPARPRKIRERPRWDAGKSLGRTPTSTPRESGWRQRRACGRRSTATACATPLPPPKSLHPKASGSLPSHTPAPPRTLGPVPGYVGARAWAQRGRVGAAGGEGGDRGEREGDRGAAAGQRGGAAHAGGRRGDARRPAVAIAAATVRRRRRRPRLRLQSKQGARAHSRKHGQVDLHLGATPADSTHRRTHGSCRPREVRGAHCGQMAAWRGEGVCHGHAARLRRHDRNSDGQRGFTVSTATGPPAPLR